METKSHRVALVVDPEFGKKAIALSRRMHVWLIESPTNTTCARQAAESRQGEYSTLTGITTFASEPNETGEDAVIRILETIDEHHDEYGSDFPWASIELLGTPLTKRLRLAFEEYGVTEFAEASGGFVAHRSIVVTLDDKALLKALGIDDAWIAMGFATPEVVSRAREEAEREDTINSEHVRYFAITQMLERTQEISQEFFRGMLDILWHDPDRMMATSAFVLLAQHPGLQDERLRILSETAPACIRKAVRRVELLRELHRNGLSEELLDEAISLRDGQLQRRILDTKNIERSTLQKLAEAGANRAVRNIATQLLRRRKT